LDEVAASAIVEKFLETQFAGDEKYKRRIDEISGLER
jgi:ribose 5-phosphate isomerase RpiB